METGNVLFVSLKVFKSLKVITEMILKQIEKKNYKVSFISLTNMLTVDNILIKNMYLKLFDQKKADIKRSGLFRIGHCSISRFYVESYFFHLT